MNLTELYERIASLVSQLVDTYIFSIMNAVVIAIIGFVATRWIKPICRKLGWCKNTTVLSQLNGHFRVIEITTYKLATDEQVKLFYSGKLPLGWNIVRKKAIIPRKLQQTILEDHKIPPSILEIICVTGQMGDGKSALTWDVSLEMSQRSKIPLLQSTSDDPNAWPLLESVLREYDRPVIVLVDDMFSNRQYADAIMALATDLPVRIMGTSRVSEVPIYQPQPIIEHLVTAPSKDEIDTAIRMVRGSLEHTPLERDIYTINNWLMLMIALSTSGNHRQYILHDLDDLARQKPDHYWAYIYVCFCYQFNVALDAAVLNALVPALGVADSAVKGYIFRSNDQQRTRYVAAHAYIAEIVVSHAQQRLAATELLNRIVAKIDFADSSQRALFGTLLTVIRGRERDAEFAAFYQVTHPSMQVYVRAAMHEDVPTIEQLVHDQQAGTVLTALYTRLLSVVPRTVSDWQSLFTISRNLQKSVGFDIVSAVRGFFTSHDDSALRAQLLTFISSVNNDNVIQLVEDVRKWLKPDSPVGLWVAYGKFITELGSAPHAMQAINDLSQQLEHRPDPVPVFDVYISLVRKYGAAPEVSRAMQLANKLLQLDKPEQIHRHRLSTYVAFLIHIEDKNALRAVRDALTPLMFPMPNLNYYDTYITIITDLGDAEICRAVVEQHADILDNESVSSHVVNLFLQLTRNYGDDKSTHRVLTKATNLIQSYPQGRIPQVYLELLEYIGDARLVQNVISLWEQSVYQSVASSVGMRFYVKFITLVHKFATPEQRTFHVNKALEILSEKLNLKELHMELRVALFKLFRQHGDVTNDAASFERVLKSTLFTLTKGESQLKRTDVWYYQLFSNFLLVVAKVAHTYPDVSDKAITSTFELLNRYPPRKEWGYTGTAFLTLVLVHAHTPFMQQALVLARAWQGVFMHRQREILDRLTMRLVLRVGDERDIEAVFQGQQVLQLVDAKEIEETDASMIVEKGQSIMRHNPLHRNAFTCVMAAARRMQSPSQALVATLLNDEKNLVLLHPTAPILLHVIAIAKLHGTTEDVRHVVHIIGLIQRYKAQYLTDAVKSALDDLKTERL
jgi:hypothetical protein